MTSKSIKVVALVLLGVLLAILPGLVGCGEKDKVGNKIIFGWDWDFTGRAALGVTMLYAGLADYLKMTKDEKPIPGVEVELLTYDGRSDAARVILGYQWLRDRGMDLFTCAPHDFQMLRSQLEEDKMPSFISSTVLPNIDSQWCVSEYGPPEGQIEVIMAWIMDNWDVAAKGKCKIGFVGLAGIPFYEMQRDMTLEIIAENHDKLELVAVQMAPTTTTLWSAELAKLMPSDYVMAGMSGPPVASFLIEARQRGYDRGLVGPLESWMAFWSLIKGIVPEADLDGVVSGFISPWWGGTGAFMDEVGEYLEKYRPGEVEFQHGGTGYLNGWSYGMMLIDALRRAADKVGGENVTGMDVFRALQETDMTVDGWKYPWRITPTVNVLMPGVKLMQYKADVGDWVQIQDYVIPPSLGG